MIWLVLLHILKWIGLVLAAVLALILLLCLFLLFSRFRYDVQVDKNVKMRVKATAKWLASLIWADFQMVDERRRLRVRVLWRRRVQNLDARTEADEMKTDESSEKRAVKKGESSEVEKDALAPEGKNKAKKDKSERKNVIERIQEIINYPDKDLIFEYTKTLLIKLLRALRPKKFAVSGVIGFDDPSVTGQVLGAVGVVTTLTGLDIALRGNFAEEELTVRGEMAGKVTLWALLWPIVCWALKKPIWKIVKPMLFKRKKKRSR